MMSTLTAQILVGNNPASPSGLIPTHQLLLFENEKPAWLLIPVDAFEMVSPPERRITWLSTPDHMLEDALLMVAVHVLRDPKMNLLAKEHLGPRWEDWVDLREDAPAADREALYAASRQIAFGCKLVLTVLNGSTIRSQLEVLSQYQVDAVVCEAT